MQTIDVSALADAALAEARARPSGRCADIVHGGRAHTMRQVVLALAAGQSLDDHENPGETTLHVLRGRVRITTHDDAWEGVAGEFAVIPRRTHRLAAVEDSVVLLSAVATPYAG